MRSFPFIGVCLALLRVTVRANAAYQNYNSTMVYDFKDIEPTPDLSWIPCLDNYTCTILQVCKQEVIPENIELSIAGPTRLH
jgi:hypothetical protein